MTSTEAPSPEPKPALPQQTQHSWSSLQHRQRCAPSAAIDIAWQAHADYTGAIEPSPHAASRSSTSSLSCLRAHRAPGGCVDPL